MLLRHSREYLHGRMGVKVRVKRKSKVIVMGKFTTPVGLTRLCKGLEVLGVPISTLAC
jgi:hypothetical protein